MQAVFRFQTVAVAALIASACSTTPPGANPTPQAPVAAVADNHSSPTSSASDASQADMDIAMRKRGYKPAVYQGVRVYCRNEAITGSNLQSKVCQTAQQIADQERTAQDIMNKTRPAGCSGGKTGCN